VLLTRRILFPIVALLLAALVWRAPVEAQSSWVHDWLRDYAAGRAADVAERLTSVSNLKTLQADLDLLLKGWLKEPGAPEDLRRRQIAAFALEAAFSRLDQGGATTSLVEWACRQVRRSPTRGDFERRFMLAAFAIFAGAVAPNELETHISHVKLLFPKEPRLTYERAVADELRAAPFFEGGRSSPREVTASYESAAKWYREAANEPSTRAEAVLRLGHVELALSHPDQALEALGQVEGATTDPALVFLARLFRGQALEKLNRPEDAAQAYELALAVAPEAQSAAMALAALRFQQGQRDVADGIVSGLLTRPVSAGDPWWLYWPADFRYAGGLVLGMREALK
jgi:tetratricopeptide (TPR) repeat protein